jgi:uncharacterized small protein (DUF1192 family)
MAYDGPERRIRAVPHEPDRRGRLTEEDLVEVVHELRERVGLLEAEGDRLAKLPDAVAELKGAVQTLSSLVITRFDGIQGPVEKAASLKTAVQFTAIVLVPIIVAIIGGYVALRGGAR